jgi:hypothetical protein
VGAPLWHNPQIDEGAAFVYAGSSSGLDDEDPPLWAKASDQAGAKFGTSVGTAGDVNGDGYADVIVGAPNYNQSKVDEGKAFLYYGNGRAGLSLNPRQVIAYSADAPIARLGWSDSMEAFCVRLSMQRPFAVGRAKMEVEVKPLGVRFDGTYTVLGHDWWISPIGSSFPVCVIGLEPGTAYHWRTRWRYQPAGAPWLPASRWVTMPWNGWSEKDLRTAGWRVALPLALRDHWAE